MTFSASEQYPLKGERGIKFREHLDKGDLSAVFFLFPTSDQPDFQRVLNFRIFSRRETIRIHAAGNVLSERAGFGELLFVFARDTHERLAFQFVERAMFAVPRAYGQRWAIHAAFAARISQCPVRKHGFITAVEMDDLDFLRFDHFFEAFAVRGQAPHLREPRAELETAEKRDVLLFAAGLQRRAGARSQIRLVASRKQAFDVDERGSSGTGERAPVDEMQYVDGLPLTIPGFSLLRAVCHG